MSVCIEVNKVGCVEARSYAMRRTTSHLATSRMKGNRVRGNEAALAFQLAQGLHTQLAQTLAETLLTSGLYSVLFGSC